MAFSTQQGSGASDVTSYVGTSGVDSIALTNSTGNFFLGAQQEDDIINFFGSGGAPSVGASTIKGGAGIDTVNGAGLLFTTLFINGNAGDDVYNLGNDVLTTNSLVQGGADDDTIIIGTIVGGITNGNKGDDTLTVTAATTASIFGGQGDDTLNVAGAIQGTEVNGAIGNDAINLTAAATTYSSSTLRGAAGNDTFTLNGGAGTILSAMVIRGGEGNNNVNGNSAQIALRSGNIVTGGTGTDVVNFTAAVASGTNTAGVTISTGEGADTISDSTINDTITGGDDNDTIALAAGGTDQVNVTDSSSVAASATSLTANLTNADTFTFGNGVDVITGFGAGAGGDVVAGTGQAGFTAVVSGATASATGFVQGTTYLIDGDFNAATGVFTVNVGAGADTMMIEGNGGSIATTTSAVVFDGTAIAGFAANNFIA